MQSDIKKYDVVISSNGQSKITADEVQEHMVMPDYCDGLVTCSSHVMAGILSELRLSQR